MKDLIHAIGDLNETITGAVTQEPEELPAEGEEGGAGGGSGGEVQVTESASVDLSSVVRVLERNEKLLTKTNELLNKDFLFLILVLWFYSGTNGSGKSLHVARDIYTRLRRRGHNKVICTFDVNVKAVKRCRGEVLQVPIYKLSPRMLTQYALKHHRLSGRPDQVEGQTLVVIDEAQRIFNPRDYDKNDRRAWLDWLPEHRKYGFNIILISPYDKMIDKQIRALFEYEVKHRKANN